MLNLSRQVTDLQASQEKSNAQVQQMKHTLRELEQGMTPDFQFHRTLNCHDFNNKTLNYCGCVFRET